MAKAVDRFIESVRKKQEKATEMFNKMYAEEEQESKKEILEEVCNQIEVCEGFCRPVTEKEIEEWLRCDNVVQVLRYARNHKVA